MAGSPSLCLAREMARETDGPSTNEHSGGASGRRLLPGQHAEARLRRGPLVMCGSGASWRGEVGGRHIGQAAALCHAEGGNRKGLKAA